MEWMRSEQNGAANMLEPQEALTDEWDVIRRPERTVLKRGLFLCCLISTVTAPVSFAALCEQAPLAHLVANPDSCDGETVRFVGYLTHRAEGSSVWLSKEDADRGQAVHGLRLEFSSRTQILPVSGAHKEISTVSDRYVELTGRVTRSTLGDRFSHVGRLQVTSVIPKSTLTAADGLFDQAETLERIDEVAYFSPAAKAYRAALGEPEERSILEVARATLRLGMSLAKLGQHDQAITSYREVLALEATSSHSNHALRLSAESLFAKGEYVAALDALHAAESAYPASGGCGTCRMEHRQEYVVSVGILNEYVRQYDTVVESYLNSGGTRFHLRLLDLYEHSGQLEDFLELVSRDDVSYGQMLEKYRRPVAPSPLSQTVHKVLRIRQMADRREWEELLRIIESDSANRPRGFEVKKAAALMAAHKKETLPLLLKGFHRPVHVKIPFGRSYALGLTQAPEAVEALKNEIEHRKNYVELRLLVYALGVGGKAGATALQELDATAGHNLRLTIERNTRRRSPWEPRGPMPYPFPEIPPGIRLPTNCVQQGGRTGYLCGKPVEE